MFTDRSEVAEFLQLAQERVAAGELHLEKQRALLEKMRHDGHATRTAEELLRSFEEGQAFYVETVQRLQRKFPDIALPISRLIGGRAGKASNELPFGQEQLVDSGSTISYVARNH